ncbi:TetR-like C-terminal domain-containing protein [Fodinicola feengrottensis]|uniref:HTH-type transcriptional regulator MT1864/Rv1816-like C-terminal domain-containing protein n=1 Tax=Fodinicola feengrottensis TaxID=435914 RepID=A0ABP4TK69_9ACTN|nr:WHG domain-containing protein [Fodinicola feengrottensis]
MYDALFEAGARGQNVAIATASEGITDPIERLRAGEDGALRWGTAHPVLAQLLFWRPVPGFTPSERAYAPAVETIDLLRTTLDEAVAAGRLSPAAAEPDGLALYTSLMAGLLSQQLSNEPAVDLGAGRYVRLAPQAIDMFCAYYTPTEKL